MKNLRKDNKGFSLVELIVVVLIMAIIAVALAPQILKWVNNSRISADNDTMQQVISNFQTALTNEKVYTEISNTAATKLSDDTELVLTIKDGSSGNTTTWSTNGAKCTELVGKFYEYSGTDASHYTTDLKTKVSGSTIEIKINNKGKVEGVYSGGSIDD